MSDLLILVDEEDNQIGVEEKMKAHREGALHRAFSVFIFNSKNQLLLQQRAPGKYHSAGLWTNTCCSHPRPGEDTSEAAHRRLKEEMGFDCEINEVFSFRYKTDFMNGLIENELDHVFIGRYEGDIIPNPEEVSSYKWVDCSFLRKDIINNPDIYTVWLKIVLEKVLERAV